MRSFQLTRALVALATFVFVSWGLVQRAEALPVLSLQEAAASDALVISDDFDFTGIVALANCSGSLVRFETSEETDQAMIMTNGHCIKLMGSDEVYVNKASGRIFRLLSPKARTTGMLGATKILYATMAKTDFALYELRKTYKDIKDRYEIEPLTISSTGPAIGDEIEVISGYWKRGYSCLVENIVHELKEDRWSWSDSIRYSRPGCETIGGTSGSPVILKGTRTAVAVNNTGNESGEECSLNNPCEIDTEGNVSFEKGVSYAQQISWIYTCLNEERQIDLELETCQLPKPLEDPISKEPTK